MKPVRRDSVFPARFRDAIHPRRPLHSFPASFGDAASRGRGNEPGQWGTSKKLFPPESTAFYRDVFPYRGEVLHWSKEASGRTGYLSPIKQGTMAVIEVENISKTFGSTRAVDDVSFSVTRGKIFGLLGPNGAGKTTAIRMVNHILIPDSGTITINGQPASPATQQMIGYMPEERGLYKKMKVGEQLLYLARLKGMEDGAARKAIRYWLDRFQASDWLDKQVGELSKGMSQKIQFIATIAHDPDIYIFDEPFSGLDPINSEMLKEIVIELRENGKTIFFSTHRMEQVEQMCDEICLFNNGRAVLNGNLREIKRSFGKNTVHIEFQGDASFLDSLTDVRINNRSTNFAEIRVLNNQDMQQILRTAMAEAEIYKFERIEPSLTDIFISTVGEDNINPKELGQS